MKAIVAIGLLLASLAAAHAIGYGGEGRIFGKLGASSKKAAVVVQPTGKIQLVDAASFILQTDATSKICRAGGC